MKSNDLDPPDESSRVGPPPELDATRVDLNKLRTFFVIAERGGVSAAAADLALTRSAVSHSLSSLEDSLGVTLFHRVGRRLVLSREGARLRRAYAEAERRIGHALDEIGDETREVRGRVRLGVYPGFSRFRLAGALERFLREHAGARCRLVQGSRSELLQGLLEGRIDFALSLLPGAPATAGRVRSTQLFEQALVLAVAKSRRRSGRGLEGLAALPLVDYFRNDPLIDRWVAHHYQGRRLARSDVRVWVGGATDLALELTCRGVGACVLPADLVEPYRRRGELVVIRGCGSPLLDGIWLNELSGARARPVQTALREALLQPAEA